MWIAPTRRAIEARAYPSVVSWARNRRSSVRLAPASPDPPRERNVASCDDVATVRDDGARGQMALEREMRDEALDQGGVGRGKADLGLHAGGSLYQPPCRRSSVPRSTSLASVRAGSRPDRDARARRQQLRPVGGRRGGGDRPATRRRQGDRRGEVARRPDPLRARDACAQRLRLGRRRAPRVDRRRDRGARRRRVRVRVPADARGRRDRARRACGSSRWRRPATRPSTPRTSSSRTATNPSPCSRAGA